MRIAILGGSFDPIHFGHLVMARVSRERLGVDEIRWIPAGEQPFKVGRHRAPAADRAEMVERAVRGIPGFVADRCEVERSGPSYTADTVAMLRARYPAARLSILLGSDAAKLFPKWRDPAAIRAEAEIIVFVRGGETLPDGVADRVVPVPRIDISSTAVRDRVRAGESIGAFVPEPVATFIAARGLYRN